MRRVGFLVLAVAIITTIGHVSAPALNADTQTFKREKILCGLVGARWLPGKKVAGIFTPFTTIVRDTKRKMQREQNSQKRTKLQVQMTKLQQQATTGKKICGKGPGTSPRPTATPTRAPGSTPPAATPTPRPTVRPTATPAGCFDSQGNTNAANPCFGIPSGLSGSINRGSTAFNSTYACIGCHTDVGRRNSSFSKVYGAFDKPDMQGVTRPSNAVLADLVAYLNRFNQGQ